ncbi:MAG TPA: radical SAM family heme chaperone HemW [Gemmatimonadota bacterium]|nr:radical SAM family heme chaperone HemW [Gemmatimonadota bacterium]
MVRSLHVYVHVPFCARKCPYCHFYNLGHDDGREAVFLDGMAREIARRRAGGAFEAARLATLYWGGGTPSLLSAAGFERLAALCLGIAPAGERFEWTVEMNPADADAERLAAYRERRVNRLSIGVQSFDPARLEFLGRNHDGETARRAVLAAFEAGFENLSVDLMFNLAVPGRRRGWARDLSVAFDLPISHLSLYGLTLESGTAFHARARAGTRLTIEDSAYAAEYRAACRAARRAGFEHYEVSSFARPGRRSRHNGAYWSGVSYLGLGPAAHSFDGVRRWANVASLVRWADALATGGDPRAFVESVGPAEREIEALYLGLRTDAGIPAGQLFGSPGTIDALVRDGFCRRTGERLVCTEKGYLLLDSILERLLPPAEGRPVIGRPAAGD